MGHPPASPAVVRSGGVPWAHRPSSGSARPANACSTRRASSVSRINHPPGAPSGSMPPCAATSRASSGRLTGPSAPASGPRPRSSAGDKVGRGSRCPPRRSPPAPPRPARTSLRPVRRSSQGAGQSAHRSLGSPPSRRSSQPLPSPNFSRSAYLPHPASIRQAPLSPSNPVCVPPSDRSSGKISRLSDLAQPGTLSADDPAARMGKDTPPSTSAAGQGDESRCSVGIPVGAQVGGGSCHPG
jgi:hypothetical protein